MSASRRPRMSTLREGRLESGTDTIKGVHNSFSACLAVCFFLSLFLMCLPSRNFLGMLPVSMKPYHGHARVECHNSGKVKVQDYETKAKPHADVLNTTGDK